MSQQKPNRRKEPPKLSELEWEIMKPLWANGPLAARDIFQQVPEHYGWAYKTVKTMIARLVKKGAIEYEQIGNSYLYRPAYSREKMTRHATGSFIDRVFDGALRPFVAHFMERVSHEELQVLKAEVRRLEKKRANDEDL